MSAGGLPTLFGGASQNESQGQTQDESQSQSANASANASAYNNLDITYPNESAGMILGGLASAPVVSPPPALSLTAPTAGQASITPSRMQPLTSGTTVSLPASTTQPTAPVVPYGSFLSLAPSGQQVIQAAPQGQQVINSGAGIPVNPVEVARQALMAPSGSAMLPPTAIAQAPQTGAPISDATNVQMPPTAPGFQRLNPQYSLGEKADPYAYGQRPAVSQTGGSIQNAPSNWQNTQTPTDTTDSLSQIIDKSRPQNAPAPTVPPPTAAKPNSDNFKPITSERADEKELKVIPKGTPKNLESVLADTRSKSGTQAFATAAATPDPRYPGSSQTLGQTYEKEHASMESYAQVLKDNAPLVDSLVQAQMRRAMALQEMTPKDFAHLDANSWMAAKAAALQMVSPTTFEERYQPAFQRGVDATKSSRQGIGGGKPGGAIGGALGGLIHAGIGAYASHKRVAAQNAAGFPSKVDPNDPIVQQKIKELQPLFYKDMLKQMTDRDQEWDKAMMQAREGLNDLDVNAMKGMADMGMQTTETQKMIAEEATKIQDQQNHIASQALAQAQAGEKQSEFAQRMQLYARNQELNRLQRERIASVNANLRQQSNYFAALREGIILLNAAPKAYAQAYPFNIASGTRVDPVTGQPAPPAPPTLMGLPAGFLGKVGQMHSAADVRRYAWENNLTSQQAEAAARLLGFMQANARQ